jgi:acyl-CoA dehydrogenase
VFPFGSRRRPPSDALGALVARSLLEDREGRLRLTADIYVPDASEPGLGSLEAALDRAVDAIAVETKLRDAVRKGLLDRAPGDMLAEEALRAAIITDDEYAKLRQAEEARSRAVEVDAFEASEFLENRMPEPDSSRLW